MQDIKLFLGLANFYQRFIQSFCKIEFSLGFFVKTTMKMVVDKNMDKCNKQNYYFEKIIKK